MLFDWFIARLLGVGSFSRKLDVNSPVPARKALPCSGSYPVLVFAYGLV